MGLKDNRLEGRACRGVRNLWGGVCGDPLARFALHVGGQDTVFHPHILMELQT